MPVPSAFNDITMERSLRDHVGWVWYQKIYYLHYSNYLNCFNKFNKTKSCLNIVSSIYFESVNYNAFVVSMNYFV